MPGAELPPALVNCTGETLTRSGSGGISTWVQGVHAAAAASGVDLPVITKRHPSLECALPGATVLDYPLAPGLPGAARVDRRLRQHLQYPHLLQPLWNRKVVRAVARLGPSPRALVTHNDPELAVVLARRFPQHRVAHLLHNTNPVGARWQKPFDRLVVALAISDFTGGWCRKNFHLTSAVTTVRNGVDTELFQPSDTRREGPLVLTYVGLFNERKGPDLLLQAALLLAGRGRPFVVRLIGATHYGRSEADAYGVELDRRAAELRNLGVDVALPGFLSRERLAQELADSDVIVVPSRCEESFGLAALEGMSSGAAAVVADRGGLPEAVGPSGLVFRPDDAGDLARVLLPLLIDAQDLEGRQRAARAWAQQCTWATTWARLAEALGTSLTS